MARNIYLRGVRGRYVFRRRVPADIARRLGRTELVKSLGPCGFREAQRQARRLAVASDRIFEMVKRSDLSREQLEDLAREWFGELMAGHEQAVTEKAFNTYEQHDRFIGGVKHHRQTAEIAVAMNDVDTMFEAADGMLERAGLALDATGPEYRELCRLLLRAYAEAQRLREARAQGRYDVKPRDPLFAVDGQANGAPARRGKPAAPLFSELVEVYVAERLRTKDWRPQTEHQNRKTFALFVEAARDRPIDAYQRADIGTFSGLIQRLPAKYGQGAAFRGKSLKELVATVDQSDGRIRAVTPRTVERHMTALHTLFDWARRQGHVEGENPVQGVFRAPKTRRAREERPAWSADQLVKLFDSAIWRGMKSDARRSRPGELIVRDALYWAPLISAFSGMRLEEIASLDLDDVREEEGVLHFDIRPGADKSLKTRAAVRKVPIHAQLIRIGFVAYVDKQRKAGKRKAFPELRPGGPDRRYGTSITKKFGRYIRDIGIEELDFQGLRHAAITALQRASVSEPIIRELVGHEGPASETSRYSKGFPLVQLKAAVDKITYQKLDLSGLK